MQEHGLIEKDINIYYRIEGEGDPVILLHGFGEDGGIWDGMTEALSSSCKLIVPDLPGSGNSLMDTDGITIESMAESINRIVEKEDLRNFYLVGHSMGGYISLAFAEKFGDKLRGLGLFHSTAYADNAEKKQVREKNMEFIRKHGTLKFLEQSVPNLFSENTRNSRPELVQNTIDRYSNFSPTSLVNYTNAMKNRPDRTEVLRKLSKPVLFIFGEYDTAVPLEQGLEQCNIPEFSYIYIAAHSGHMGMLEEPEFCLKALQDFLSAK
jgi:pimeloyl-ACP methyl ester carboxylesterase